LNGRYYVIATDKNNGLLQSCPVAITPTAKTGGISVSPNPAQNGSSVTIMSNYTQAQLLGAKLTITSLTGTVVTQLANVQPVVTITLASWVSSEIYIVSLQWPDGRKETTSLLIK
jgi:hypothetical protein